jgi:phage terminase large subunit-like protein
MTAAGSATTSPPLPIVWTPDAIEAACRSALPGYDPWADAAGFSFDRERAARVVAFAHELCTFTVSTWAGHRFILQPWQVALLANLFGWVDPNGLRRYRKVLLSTARKSGKTELAAVVANYLLFADGEPTPEIVSAAGNAEQATKVFNAAAAMVRNEPELVKRAEMFAKSIRCVANGGSYRVINASARTKHGGNLHAALVDELHVMLPDLIDVLETSMRSRRQPLMFFTTTAGTNPESIAGEVWDYACKVRDGLISDPTFLPAVFTAPPDADIADPAVWRMAQPNLDVTVPSDEYARDLREARAVPRKMAVFRQLSLNQWTETAASWLGLEEWKACAAPFALDDLRGCRATLGIDLSSTTDTTAVVAAIEHEGQTYVHADIFIPKDNAEGRFRRQARDKAPYTAWIRDGLITATEGNTVDYAVVERRIVELAQLLDVREIQADPFNASGLLERLMKAGLPVVTVRQGWSLAQATKEVERMVLARELAHPDNAAFNFQVASAAVKQDDQGNQWLTKGRSVARIDAAVSMVMAVNALRFGAGAKSEGDGNYYASHPELVVL